MRTKLLFVCSGNKDRSPTAEAMFLVDCRYVAKSAGIDDDAPVKLSKELIEWADLVFAMQDEHRQEILRLMPRAKKTRVLNIPDIYHYGDPELVNLLRERLVSNNVLPHNRFKGKCECGGRIVVASDGDLVCRDCGEVHGYVAMLCGRDSGSCNSTQNLPATAKEEKKQKRRDGE